MGNILAEAEVAHTEATGSRSGTVKAWFGVREKQGHRCLELQKGPSSLLYY